MKIAVINHSEDALVAKIEARRSDDTKIVITCTAQSDGITEIRVKVGFFGDKEASSLILDKIVAHLK